MKPAHNLYPMSVIQRHSLSNRQPLSSRCMSNLLLKASPCCLTVTSTHTLLMWMILFQFCPGSMKGSMSTNIIQGEGGTLYLLTLCHIICILCTSIIQLYQTFKLKSPITLIFLYQFCLFLQDILSKIKQQKL